MTYTSQVPTLFGNLNRSIIPSSSPDALITNQIMNHAHALWRVLRLAEQDPNFVDAYELHQEINTTYRKLTSDLLGWTINHESRRPSQRRELQVLLESANIHLKRLSIGFDSILSHFETQSSRDGLLARTWFRIKGDKPACSLETLVLLSGDAGIDTELELCKRALIRLFEEAKSWV